VVVDILLSGGSWYLSWESEERKQRVTTGVEPDRTGLTGGRKSRVEGRSGARADADGFRVA